MRPWSAAPIALILLTLLLAPAGSAADDDKPSLKIVNPAIQVVPGTGGVDSGELIVQAENFPKEKLGKTPKVEDLRVPAIPFVQVPAPVLVKELSRRDTGAVWLFKISATGLPKQSTVARKLLLVLGDVQTTADYTITNKPVAAFSWSLLAPPVWNLNDSTAAEIPVVVKDAPATGIRILSSTLTRQGSPSISLGVQSLELCANAGAPCQPPPPTGPNESRLLYLHLKNAGNGNYTGGVVIQCDQKPEGDSVALTLNITSTNAMAWGVAAIALGVILYFLVVVLARYYVSRNGRDEVRLMLLKEADKAEIKAVHSISAAPEWAIAATKKDFADLKGQLSSAQFALVMPGLLTPDDRGDEFKSRIQELGTQLTSLQTVVESGISKIAPAWLLAGHDLAKQAMVKKAVTDMLAVPDGKINAADTKTKVNAILTPLYTALGAAPPASAAPTTDAQLQHVWLATRAWTWVVVLVWAAATILTGAMAMVFSKAGFGTPMDFATCLLWGMGLPAAGTQLNSLTSASIGTTLGITLPKAS